MAHALAALPLTSAALAAGKISYSKVRALSRVATADNEDFFLGFAEYGTASHLEKTVRLVKRGLAEAACAPSGGGASVAEVVVHVQTIASSS